MSIVEIRQHRMGIEAVALVIDATDGTEFSMTAALVMLREAMGISPDQT